MPVDDALFLFGVLAAIVLGMLIGAKLAQARLHAWLAQAEKSIRSDAVQRSRQTLGGKFAEQLAPFLPGFKYDPTDARFLGSPVDLIVFDGLANNEPQQIVFMEVKTGNSQLSGKERKVRQLVEQGKVVWEELRV